MKQLPQATEFEEAVLGAMLLDRDAVETVLPILTPEAFYLSKNALIYKSISDQYADGKPIDLITVCERLRKTGELDLAGGAYWVTELTNRVASSAHVEEHARIVSEKHILRSLIMASNRIREVAFDATQDTFDVLDEANRELETINDLLSGQHVTPGIEEVISNRIKQLQELSKREEGLVGVPTGFDRLDSFTGGWQQSNLIIIAARPSMGKTALMLALANNAANAGYKVGISSLEMSLDDLADRLIATNAEVNTHKLRAPREITSKEWGRITGIRLQNMHLQEKLGPSIRAFRIWAKEMVKKKGCKMLIVDYLQLMEDNRGYGDNRENEVSKISRGLKQCARELKVPVIALSQLNRGCESRNPPRPRLSDLRESGAIEQDADIVGFLYRPEYYKILQDEMGNSTEGMAELVIEKNRNGDTGITSLRWEAQYTRFLDSDEHKRFTELSKAQSNGKDDYPF